MRIDRRSYLKGMTAGALALRTTRAPAQAALPKLPDVATDDALLLRPGDVNFASYASGFNLRTTQQPLLRALCKTPKAVATMVSWARDNNVPFALRSGGHSYEGFSQSTSVVIDTRLMNRVDFDASSMMVTAGAGTTLTSIYGAICAAGFGFPGGSCPTVGITGHALGGGYGLLARSHGLACDALQSIQLVNAQGALIEANATQNTDLFWACRGGGGGSFGAVTRLRFKVLPVSRVFVLRATWDLAPERAANLFNAWQAWAPHAPSAITAFLTIGKGPGGKVRIHCAGQSLGTEDALRRELKALTSIDAPTDALTIEQRSALGAVQHFYGNAAENQPLYFKAKSDYVMQPLSPDGIATLIAQILQCPAASPVIAICDPYGGAIAQTAPDASAFAHRTGTLYSIQYMTDWTAADRTDHLAAIRTVYAAMRPFVSGAAYLNYCDLDLATWQDAYWGKNLARLKQIKAAVDPDNLFRHAQSVPAG